MITVIHSYKYDGQKIFLSVKLKYRKLSNPCLIHHLCSVSISTLNLLIDFIRYLEKLISPIVRLIIVVITFQKRQNPEIRKMLKVKDFCCGLLSLRVGCIVIAVVHLILCVSNGGWYLNWGWRWSWNWSLYILLILEVLVGIFLLLGVILDKFQLVLASAIGLLIAIVLRVIIIIIMVVVISFSNAGIMIAVVFFALLIVALDIYFAIVILSYYDTMGRTRIF